MYGAIHLQWPSSKCWRGTLCKNAWQKVQRLPCRFLPGRSGTRPQRSPTNMYERKPPIMWMSTRKVSAKAWQSHLQSDDERNAFGAQQKYRCTLSNAARFQLAYRVFVSFRGMIELVPLPITRWDIFLTLPNFPGMICTPERTYLHAVDTHTVRIVEVRRVEAQVHTAPRCVQARDHRARHVVVSCDDIAAVGVRRETRNRRIVQSLVSVCVKSVHKVCGASQKA